MAAFSIGIVYAIVLLVLGFLVGGGGHGWNSAAFISLFCCAVIPFSFWCSFNWRHRAARTCSLLVIGAMVLLDIALVIMTYREGVQYFHNSGSPGSLWLALWSGAHAPPIMALFWQSDSLDGLLE